MDEFPSNAHQPQNIVKPGEAKREQQEEQKPRVTRVVEGNVVRRKKPLGTKMKDMFLGGESHGVFGYLLEQVLVPAAKDMLEDLVIQGVQRQLWGDTRPGGRAPRGGAPTAYNRYYNGSASGSALGFRPDTPKTPLSNRARAMHNFDEIILPTRREADEVIAQMFDLLERFRQVTVADLYEMINITPNYPDRTFGWVDLKTADIERVAQGYLLRLPRPEALD